MSIEIEYSCYSHIGKVRPSNQDNFSCNGVFFNPSGNEITFPMIGKLSPDKPVAFGVFDGMGGEECGDVASFIAAKTAAETEFIGDSVTALREYCITANNSICEFAKNNNVGSMGTTAALLLFNKKGITLCNIGDSKVYMLSGNEFSQLSTDHVSVSSYGTKPPLSQNLGIPTEEMIIQPYFATGDYNNNDKFLICSDGLTDMLSEADIEKILKETPTSAIAAKLIEESLEKGGKDNVTVIALEVKITKKLFGFIKI